MAASVPLARRSLEGAARQQQRPTQERLYGQYEELSLVVGLRILFELRLPVLLLVVGLRISPIVGLRVRRCVGRVVGLVVVRRRGCSCPHESPGKDGTDDHRGDPRLSRRQSGSCQRSSADCRRGAECHRFSECWSGFGPALPRPNRRAKNGHLDQIPIARSRRYQIQQNLPLFDYLFGGRNRRHNCQ